MHDDPAAIKTRTQKSSNDFKDFIIWVDGVGGFLVCCGDRNTIGQAIPNSDVTIPLRGDLNRQHVIIETIEGRHLLHPVGPVHIDGKRLKEPTILIGKENIQMGEAVVIGYRIPHPLSSTAVLDFVSRHRTFPWSDGVLIAGEAIVMGAQTRNHIVCPHWQHELILYRRPSGWCCKTNANCFIDGQPLTDQMLTDKSYITGDDFSFSIEAI